MRSYTEERMHHWPIRYLHHDALAGRQRERLTVALLADLSVARKRMHENHAGLGFDESFSGDLSASLDALIL